MAKRKYPRDEIVRFIEHFALTNEFPATLEDICEEFDCPSTGTMYGVLKGLVEEGILTKEEGKHRTYRMVSVRETRLLMKRAGFLIVPRWVIEYMLRQIPDGEEKEFIKLALEG